MIEQSSPNPDALPQLIGDFHPVDVWQAHTNHLFYELRGSQIRDYYQTFSIADYRLAYALAEDYYQRLRQRETRKKSISEHSNEQNIEEKSPPSPASPLTIMEWGCGNGNLAACFLDRLQDLDKGGAFYPRVQYILMDRVESMLEQARKNEDLAKHRDRVTYECVDLQNLQAYQDQSVDRIICNELWSELPTKLIIRSKGDLLEEYLRPNLTESKLAEMTDWAGFVNAFERNNSVALEGYPSFLEDLVWEREYRKVEAKVLPFRRTIAEFLKGIDEEVLVPVNLGAATTLQEAKRLLAPDGIGFSSFDAGTTDRHVLNDPEKPCYAIHGGQFSFIVNLALLEEIAAQVNIKSMTIEAQKEFVGRSLGTNAMSLMDLLASHPSLPKPDSWETDALILRTIHALNEQYRSPYERLIEFPIRESIPSEQRSQLESLLTSLRKDGVPDTIAYLTENDVFGVMTNLENLGYDREMIRGAFMAPPQPVDYNHFFFSV